VGTGITLTSGAGRTFYWVYRASGSGSVLFSADAVGEDAQGVLAPTALVSPNAFFLTAPAYYITSVTQDPSFPNLDIQSPLANPVILPGVGSTWVVTAQPASIGQLVTVRMTVSNTGGSDILGMVPTISATSTNWAAMSLVTATTSAGTPMPMLRNGGSAVFDVVISITTNGRPIAGADTLTLTLGGNYVESVFSSFTRAIPATYTLTLDVQPTSVATGHGLVNEFFLSANYFTPAVGEHLTLYLSIKKDSRVKIRVFNVAAELVRNVLDADLRASSDPNNAILYSGSTDSRLNWDGRADDGQPVSAGTYLISIEVEADNFRTIKKVNVLR
jgi:hypothetical protein